VDIVDAPYVHAFPPNVHAYHDGGLPRADELLDVTTVSSKLGWIRCGWSYIGWSIGGDANRPDCINIIADPKFEAG
jgi:hypothetical protein